VALTHLPSKVSSPFIDGHILFQLRCFKVGLKFSTAMWITGEITAVVTQFLTPPF